MLARSSIERVNSVFLESTKRGTIFPAISSSFAKRAIGRTPAMSIVLIFIKIAFYIYGL